MYIPWQWTSGFRHLRGLRLTPLVPLLSFLAGLRIEPLAETIWMSASWQCAADAEAVLARGPVVADSCWSGCFDSFLRLGGTER